MLLQTPRRWHNEMPLHLIRESACSQSVRINYFKISNFFYVFNNFHISFANAYINAVASRNKRQRIDAAVD